MKKFLSVVLALIIGALSVPFTAFAAENGLKVYESVIVVSSDASATDIYASQRLKHYLDRITGKNIEIVNDFDSSEYEICVGETNRDKTDFSESADGSYIITSTDKRIIINGAGNKGTINGVYAFLEKFCGCHWYETQVIIAPENSTLTVPADIDIKYTPFFEYTETDTASSRDIEFSLANGLIGGAYRDFTAEQGTAVEYLGRFCHTMTTFFCKSETYFEEHPEYFALRNGKRTPNQLCLTNEKVKDIVTAEVLELLESEHNPDADIQIVSLTQHDNFDYCQCNNCKAIDDENGSQSGTMITFVNEIARRVKEHGYDNVVFDTFAYQYTRKAPTKVVPREDVIVRLCSIECCFGHTLDDPKCEQNVDFMNDLRKWGKICNRIYIWDYVHNYANTLCIFPNFGVLQRNIQIFYENNAKGLYEEGNYYIDNSDAEFAEMRTYLLSKLMQNPYLDYEAEMDGYLNGVYGPGGRYIREFIDIITEHAVTDSKHLSIYQSAENTLYNMTDEDVEKCNELWKKAKIVAEDDEQLQQIRRTELSWRYWKAANKRGEFSRCQFPYVWMSEGEKLHNDLKEMNAVLFSEGGTNLLSDCELLYLYRVPYKWTVVYEEWFWDVLNPLAVGFYKLL
ncbi:MAG: DUF4838 domain-containing protein, partial [Clostridia bacterium]|nr:DUF4838 domain-containing protein [Clostridia bacterium]